MIQRHIQALSDDQAGSQWQALFKRLWPAYKRWYLSEGEKARPSYLRAVQQLRHHMPELLLNYERLVELAGGSDFAARFLTLYRPPPYLSACSQLIWTQSTPFIVRNYDYSPRLFEGVILKTHWNNYQVMGTSDCLWGLTDGINDAGVAVSLTFGGRRIVGKGFGVPLILRYVLEFCDSCASAVEALCRIPSHMAYNVAVLDRSGQHATVFIAPDRKPIVSQTFVTTNHQLQVEWQQHAQATASVEREDFLKKRLEDTAPQQLIQAFLQPPLYANDYIRGFGTLYTSVLRPREGRIDYLWPGLQWSHDFKIFDNSSRFINYSASKSAPRINA